MDYAALKTEITTDPATLGYAALVSSGNDQGIAGLLNLVRSGTTYQQSAGVIPSYKVINATVAADWTALTSNEKQRYQTLTGAGLVDASDPNVTAAFAAMFAAGTTTRANLQALANRAGSRAELLFGAGVVVTNKDIAIALRST